MAGQPGSIQDLRGKVVLVNFWATWCGPCRHELPMLSAMQKQYADRGLVVVYLSLEERAIVEPFLRAHPLNGTTASLTHAADYYQAGKFYPITYLVSRDGSVEKRWSGRPTEQWLADSIEAQL
jgi:thiol-disulfide isomerase/thioredoxin